MVLVEEKILQKSSKVVIIKGQSGSGKSVSLHHVATQLQHENEFQIIPADLPDQIKKYHNPNRKQIFVFDDVCGKYCTNSSIVNQWRNLSEDIEKMLKENTHILMACNSNILEDIKDIRSFQIDDTEDNVFDLQSKGTCSLDYTQRKEIADIYLGQDSYDNEILTTETEYFPLLCQMFATQNTGNIRHFFEMNFCDLLSLKTCNDKTTYAVLCLFVITNNLVSEANTTSDTLKDITKELKIRPPLSWDIAQTLLDDMCNSYVSKLRCQYRIINDKIFNLLIASFGRDMFLFILKHGCSQFIRDRFQLQSTSQGDDECSIDVMPENEPLYFERLLRDISNGYVTDVFKNKQIANEVFRKNLISHIKKSPSAIDVILSLSEKKESPLLTASKQGYLDLVEYFIEIGMNVDVSDSEGRTPLYLASAEGFKDIVKNLLNNNSNCSLYKKNSPLYIAIKNDHMAIAEELLKKNADPNDRTVREIKLDLILQLYEDESSLSLVASSITNRTPIFIASLKGRKQCVELLLKYGADPNMCAYYNVSPLYAAAEEGHLEVVNLLLENDANVNEEADNKKTPLHVASEKGHYHIVKRLIEAGALIDASDDNGATPLLAAIKNKKESVIQLLVENKADPNKLDKQGNFPLRASVSQPEISKLLLDNNADPNLMNDKKECALLFASEKGNIDTVKLLLDQNADPNIKTLVKGSSLFAAVERDSTQIVHALLSCGADPDDRNQSNQSVLSVASEYCNENIIKMIKNAREGILPKCNQISDPLNSSSNPELTVIQEDEEVKKPILKDGNIYRNKLNEVTKIAQKDTDASLKRGLPIFSEQTLFVKGNKINLSSKTLKKPVASKSRKLQNFKNVVPPRPKAKVKHFRP
ncbi:ankyrin-1-like [Mytilus californianus]|uniref:ankyrin-1-like n=1 Tax=Mytilus californianus TaxID=6549 RepID=UPI002246F49F|nr:ankyrin-1-like [Mytilus californianus]